MFMINHLVGFGVASSAIQTAISQATGTTFGDMTGGGGLAATVDDNTAQDNSTAARGAGTGSRYAGRNWSAAKLISKFVAYPATDIGFENQASTIQLRLYGKNSSPANATDGTLLYDSGVIADTTSPVTVDRDAMTVSSSYTYHWLTLTPTDGSAIAALAELYFWEDI